MHFKKLTALLLSLFLTASLCACGQEISESEITCVLPVYPIPSNRISMAASCSRVTGSAAMAPSETPAAIARKNDEASLPPAGGKPCRAADTVLSASAGLSPLASPRRQVGYAQPRTARFFPWGIEKARKNRYNQRHQPGGAQRRRGRCGNGYEKSDRGGHTGPSAGTPCEEADGEGYCGAVPHHPPGLLLPL